MICAFQWMLLRPRAMLVHSRMPLRTFQLQSDLGDKGHELFSQYSSNFSLAFDRESHLINSNVLIKDATISFFLSLCILVQLFSPDNVLQFRSLFFPIDLFTP